MSDCVYETHIMKDSLLPFIFHRNTAAGHADFFNWHENLELLCILSGSGYILCNSRIYSVQAGDVFVVNSNCVHSTGSHAECRYHCLILDRNFCAENSIPQCFYQPVVRDPELYQQFLQVAELFALPPDTPWRATRIRHSILGLMILLCSRYTISGGSIPEKSPALERVKKAMTYIRSHLSQPMNLDELSALVGVSKYHFSREFKALTGETVVDSVNILRCQEARRLMEEGMTVSEAARASGFENLSYFSRTFKKHLGLSPSRCLAQEEQPPVP